MTFVQEFASPTAALTAFVSTAPSGAPTAQNARQALSRPNVDGGRVVTCCACEAQQPPNLLRRNVQFVSLSTFGFRIVVHLALDYVLAYRDQFPSAVETPFTTSPGGMVSYLGLTPAPSPAPTNGGGIPIIGSRWMAVNCKMESYWFSTNATHMTGSVVQFLVDKQYEAGVDGQADLNG